MPSANGNPTTTSKRALTTLKTRKKKARGGGKSRSGSGKRLRWGRYAFIAFLLLCVWAGYVWGTLPEVSDVETKNPPTTALIEHRAEEARAKGRRPLRRQHWVGLAQMPKHAVDAVLISEDARFYEHEGVDLKETRAALEEAWEKKGLGRGASTITQQLAKNLWLSSERSLFRKAKELILARRLEAQLPKRRILTLYLNVAEWGDGVYGIEAAARTHFGITASELSPAQGAILAAMLPAPRKWTPDSGSRRLKDRALRIVDRLARYGRISPDAAAAARVEVQAQLAVGGDVGDEL